jgi:cyanophycin synthetase
MCLDILSNYSKLKDMSISNVLLIIMLIIILFFIINNFFKKPQKEHMTMKNSFLQEVLNKNGFNIDVDTYTIEKCDRDDEKEECKKIVYGSRNFNNTESHYLAKNKNLSNKIFMDNNIPVPRHWIINKKNKDDFIDFDLPYPRVLKPVDGMQGKDVNTFIKTPQQFNKILNNLLKKYDQVMLENQVYGDNYRVFVFNNQVMDIIKREQPFIIGDSKTSIKDLIEQKNNLQKEKNLFPTTNLDWAYILEQGYNKIDILPLDTLVFITNTINFHNGANPVRIPLDDVPQINLDMFVKAHQLIGLECSGIDYMSPNITVPYNENNGHIIEINDMVDTKIHIDADEGDKPYLLFENIADSLKKLFL